MTMNRYAATGLMLAASEGKTVLVIEHTREASREALRDFESVAEPFGDEVRRIQRVNGAERIDMMNGGSVRFASQGSSIRGMSADVVFIDWPVELDDPHFIDQVAPLIAGPDAELIRA